MPDLLCPPLCPLGHPLQRHHSDKWFGSHLCVRPNPFIIVFYALTHVREYNLVIILACLLQNVLCIDYLDVVYRRATCLYIATALYTILVSKTKILSFQVFLIFQMFQIYRLILWQTWSEVRADSIQFMGVHTVWRNVCALDTYFGHSENRRKENNQNIIYAVCQGIVD